MKPTIWVDASASRPIDLQDEVLAGLSAVPRTVPPKRFCDTVGSALFEAITRQAGYYLTRAETDILTTYADDCECSEAALASCSRWSNSAADPAERPVAGCAPWASPYSTSRWTLQNLF